MTLFHAIFVLSLHGYAQSVNDKQIGFGTGVYNKTFQDEAVSASNNSGTSMSILFFFRSDNAGTRHHVQLLLTAPHLTSNNLLTRDKSGYLQYSQHRCIKNFKNNARFLVGGVGEINGSYLKYSERGNSYSYSYPFTTLESNISLSPSVLFEMPFGADLLTMQAWTAIMGYSFGGFKNARGLVWTGDFSNTGARVSYTKYFSTRWEGRLDYQFQYYILTKFETTSSVVHQMNFFIVYKIH